MCLQAVTYHAIGSSKLDETSVSEKLLGYVDAHSSRTWLRESLQIPALPPSNLTNCRVIDLSYSVRVGHCQSQPFHLQPGQV